MQIQRLAISLGALAAPSVTQGIRGFSYGSKSPQGSCQGYDGFKQLFERAKNLPGAPGFTTARLYTSIQCGTSAAPIEAYRAAIDTDTKILVGLWASAGNVVFENELNALLAAARTLGTAFTDRVVGISVGSEDLYRNTKEGRKNGAGATAGEIQGYIGWLRDWIRGTPLEGKPITHVDTWTAWVLPENSGVVGAVDFLGHNSFPYFEVVTPNAIEKAADHFWSAVSATESVAQGKAVWVTETGWPDTGPTFRDAVPSVSNAKAYWNTIGCSLFGKRNTFWYTLVDGAMTDSELSFAITRPFNRTPKFDLACH
ncbi:putative glycoside hydrolase family 17 protein [Rosellinia necatrix]|uniref:glucan endo-1,3-beta-D-glucosidase n=1 Tax=Rosellinia necatrix TaxID=77044 RepID=A0A1S7UJF8_ROSNE|nr:putative glycoside hydrolase family 17 protein [Rosellinia necatrix]